MANELQDALVPVTNMPKERFEQGRSVERFEYRIRPELVRVVGSVPPSVASGVVEVEAGDVGMVGILAANEIVTGIGGRIDPVARDHQAPAVARANVGVELGKKRRDAVSGRRGEGDLAGQPADARVDALEVRQQLAADRRTGTVSADQKVGAYGRAVGEMRKHGSVGQPLVALEPLAGMENVLETEQKDLAQRDAADRLFYMRILEIA